MTTEVKTIPQSTIAIEDRYEVDVDIDTNKEVETAISVNEVAKITIEVSYAL